MPYIAAAHYGYGWMWDGAIMKVEGMGSEGEGEGALEDRWGDPVGREPWRIDGESQSHLEALHSPRSVFLVRYSDGKTDK